MALCRSLVIRNDEYQIGAATLVEGTQAGVLTLRPGRDKLTPRDTSHMRRRFRSVRLAEQGKQRQERRKKERKEKR